MDSFLTRSAKRLEQALGVPRPWELTPATSIGYQMATGEGSIGERARKGTAQFIGRYATNIKQPYDYRLTGYFESLPSMIKSVATDRPSWIDENFFSNVAARDVLYREMFDLPTRTETSDIEKTGEKQYRLKDWPQPKPMPSSKPFPHSMGGHRILRGVYFQPTPEGNYRYDDVWDIVSPEDVERTDVSARLRKLIAPILRPATVSGEVPAPSNFSGFPTSHPFVKNPDGSQSNVKLSSWDIDGKTYVIPTMVGGKELKGKAAVKVAMDYGLDKYPSFSDSKSAEQWIDKYHGKIGEDGRLLE